VNPSIDEISRAAAHVMLGEEDLALTELEADQGSTHFSGWWYVAELDPLFASLRQHPRFRALADRANQHRAQQRPLLEKMRRRGEVPMRPARK
jgi:hypothetical protein